MQLAHGVVAFNPYWSPDSRRIAFAGRKEPVGPLTLWLVSADGGDAAPYRPEINSGWDAVWSRDGKRIVLGQIGRVPPGESRIKILHLETGKVEEVPGGDNLFSPRWSQDEKQLIALDFATDRLHLFDPVKQRWREIHPASVGFPTWSNDGKSVFVEDVQDGAIYRVDVASGRRVQIVSVDFRKARTAGAWVGWTKDWDPLVLRDTSSTQVYRIDLDR
jgi:Tol biopolymer transport system component